MCYERKSALGIHRTHILNKDKIDFSKDATGIWICQVERLQLWRLNILIVNYSKQLETYLSSTGTSFSTLLLQQGERRSFSPLSNYSTNEKWLKLSQWKATTLWISIFSNGICLQQLLWTPYIKNQSSLLFSGLALVRMFQIAIFCCSESTHSAGEISGHLFKVNRSESWDESTEMI